MLICDRLSSCCDVGNKYYFEKPKLTVHCDGDDFYRDGPSCIHRAISGPRLERHVRKSEIAKLGRPGRILEMEAIVPSTGVITRSNILFNEESDRRVHTYSLISVSTS